MLPEKVCWKSSLIADWEATLGDTILSFEELIATIELEGTVSMYMGCNLGTWSLSVKSLQTDHKCAPISHLNHIIKPWGR